MRKSLPTVAGEILHFQGFPMIVIPALCRDPLCVRTKRWSLLRFAGGQVDPGTRPGDE